MTAKIRAKAKAIESKIKAKAKAKAKRIPKKLRVPKGFEKIPGQDGARYMIDERLEDTRARLAAEGIDSRVYVHEYDNGEIDGEIAVMVEKRKKNAAVEASFALERALQTQPHGMKDFWLSLGMRIGFSKKVDEERSGTARVRGMDDMQMYYRKMTTPGMIDSFLRQQKLMIPRAEKRYKRKIEIVYLRINWNPGNSKPER